MNYTQFYGNTFLFINKDAEQFPLAKENPKVDLIMYYREIEKPTNDTRKQYTCKFINKDSSEASLCGNALFRLMEQEGVGHYIFHTISELYEGWNNENEIGLLMKKADVNEWTSNTEKDITVLAFDVNEHHIALWLNQKHGKILMQENFHSVIQKDINTFEVRCFEKGVGETQACGSGAYAVGIAMIKRFKLNKVNIIMKGGKYIVKEGFLIVTK